MEVRAQDGPWRPVAALTRDSQPGSISNNLPSRLGGGRDVIMFRCEGGHSVISRSSAGADYEAGPDRVLLTAGDVELARLHTGESYEMAVTTDRGVSCTVRWTHR